MYIILFSVVRIYLKYRMFKKILRCKYFFYSLRRDFLKTLYIAFNEFNFNVFEII